MKLTQPGQQDVRIGSSPFPFSLSTNSFASSIIVRSAAKFVSNTLSNPSLLKAVTIFPSTLVPTSIPNISPRATLTAGATCTITCLSDERALQTSGIFDFSVRAPVGHTDRHWPQKVQVVSNMDLLKVDPT